MALSPRQLLLTWLTAGPAVAQAVPDAGEAAPSDDAPSVAPDAEASQDAPLAAQAPLTPAKTASAAPPKTTAASAQTATSATVAPIAAPSTPPAPERKRQPATFGFQLSSGVVARVGGGLDPAFAEHERVDLAYGFGAWFAPNELLALGLRIERIGQGGEESKTGAATLRVQRDIDALWLGARVYAARMERLGLYMGLGVGLSAQRLSANGARPSQNFGPGSTFTCRASDGPGLSLSGGGGTDLQMDDHLAFIAEGAVSAFRHSGDRLDGCAPGSGSVTNVSAMIGLLYRFEVEALSDGL